jgi:hypothetical protein
MYLRMTQRRNRDGSTVAYYALAENAWNAAAKRAEARVVHNFGRADQLDRAALQRLVNSINRVLNQGETITGGTPELPPIEIERVFELGVVLAARGLWEDLGIGAAIRRCIVEGGLTAPHEAALFAMVANRLARCRSHLLRHHHGLFRDRRGGRGPRGMGWAAVRAAALARPQQGRARQPATGDHRAGGDARWHAAPGYFYVGLILMPVFCSAQVHRPTIAVFFITNDNLDPVI